MIVYIDGENAVHQLVDALRRMRRLDTREQLLGFDVAELVHQLVGKRDITIKYYNTSLKVVKTTPELEQRSQDMVSWMRRWDNHLAKQDIQVITAGKLMARDGVICRNCGHREPVFQEKGVDVRLAVDLLVDAETDKMQVIWSSDADLLPAVQAAKSRGARIKNLAHKDALNWALARQCGEWQTYSDKQLIKLADNMIEKPHAD
ncbi:MAG: hypothetical protein JWN01_198 [Patescibacteria group bacterium]|nr:hypothetical protein [Patescibacteria group bacterium]